VLFPVFPVTLPALAPLHQYASLIWLGGVILLWLTRFTHQLGRRWGRSYYMLSTAVRPIGVALVVLGWLAVFSLPRMGGPALRDLGFMVKMVWLPRRNAADVLCMVAILLFFSLFVASVCALGLRRSFLYRHADDGLVTRGPYSIVRHPQFLASIGMVFFTSLLYGYGRGDLPMVNCALFSLALWVLSILEEKELRAHFGAEYDEYAERVPRLFPN